MATDILHAIAAATGARVAAQMTETPLDALRAACRDARRTGSTGRAAGRFEAALRAPGLSFICEVKRSSPSKGLIAPDFPYVDIARTYAQAGATAISCLTEPRWFGGSDAIFGEIRAAVDTPMLRKDFTVGRDCGAPGLQAGIYQMYQAALLGADAVLLICALLDDDALARFLDLSAQLGMDALVETHDAGEVARAVACGAHIIGVNNRNLHNFTVDLDNAARLRTAIPPDRVFVAESGVRTPADAARLAAQGADAVLVGEALMRAQDKAAVLDAMRRAAR